MTGLYLHIPFCRRKCAYCDFYSVVATKADLQSYPQLLRQHLNLAVQQGWQGPIETVYFGGGTPSLLAPQTVADLLGAIDRQLGLDSSAEITLEANPGTVDKARLTGYRAAGVNRLSLGLQTLNAKQLVTLGRQHSRPAGLAAVRQARQAGFANLSLDLMFGLPGQRLADLEGDLAAYLDIAPEHLSCYGLTAEPGTPFAVQVAAGHLQLPDDDLSAEAFLLIHEQLTGAGFDHYEIANYARPGFACQHNLGYWQRQPYLGLGAGAHSFEDRDWGRRWAVPTDLHHYQKALQSSVDPSACIEEFDREGALSETLYLALRTRQGISDRTLQRRFGCRLSDAFPQAVAQLAPWLTRRDDCWSLTPAGWLLYDRLIQAFLQ